ncbi:hypothetical protein PHL116M10_45 [Propionibacterium phage PHL116M10]|uniref:Uncharacterized protein n=1 Tax=Propionibacterium phage PHL116M10 TaxID=1500817 RepID=A0A0E3DM75_9CAUD|nr:hypothetical protein PHL116M10_45 [Propionibacterium phage PHL116M10]
MKREHTPTPIFLSCPSSFDTAGGVVEKTNTPPRSRHPLKRTKQPLESNGRARARYSYPQTIPGRYRGHR